MIGVKFKGTGARVEQRREIKSERESGAELYGRSLWAKKGLWIFFSEQQEITEGF